MTVSMHPRIPLAGFASRLHEQQPWGRPGIEPPLGEVLADPIVQAVMRRDGISLAALQSIIGHVFAWVHPGLRSSSSSPSAPRPEKDGWSPAPSPRGRGSSFLVVRSREKIAIVTLSRRHS
jgi:hypothetical protein